MGGLAFLALYGLLLLAGVPGLVLRGLLFNIGPVTALAFAPGAIRAAHGRQRWGWVAVAGLAANWCVAEAIYSGYELLGRDAPVPSLADGFYYLGYLSLIVAVPLLAPPHRRLSDRRALLDGATTAAALGTLTWELLVEPTQHESSSLVSDLVLMGYPLLDLGLIVSLIVSFYAASGSLPRHTLALLVAAGLWTGCSGARSDNGVMEAPPPPLTAYPIPTATGTFATPPDDAGAPLPEAGPFREDVGVAEAAPPPFKWDQGVAEAAPPPLPPPTAIPQKKP